MIHNLQLNLSLDNFSRIFAVCNLTLPSVSSNNVQYSGCPSDFNHTNIICLGILAQNANGTWYQSNGIVPVYIGRLNYTADTTLNGKSARVILYKFI